MATSTSLAKKYEKWEHMKVDEDDNDEDIEKKNAHALEEARRQLQAEVKLEEEEEEQQQQQSKQQHEEQQQHHQQQQQQQQETSASEPEQPTKSSEAPLIEEMDEADLGTAGLEIPANDYTKALDVFMHRDGETFLSRWNKMAPQMRMNVVDVTFDAMLNHTVENTTGFRLSREDYFTLCPEISPDGRRLLARDADEFPKLVHKTIKTTKQIAIERLRRRRAELQNVTIELGRNLQYHIVIGDEEAEGSLELFSTIYRLLVAETLVCVFEALIGRKAADMDHMKKDVAAAAASSQSNKNIEDELD